VVDPASGAAWSADAFFRGGAARSVPGAVTGANGLPVFNTYRFFPMTTGTSAVAYEAPLAAGSYRVRLYFANVFVGAASAWQPRRVARSR
jgi:hypothetical protein